MIPCLLSDAAKLPHQLLLGHEHFPSFDAPQSTVAPGPHTVAADMLKALQSQSQRANSPTISERGVRVFSCPRFSIREGGPDLRPPLPATPQEGRPQGRDARGGLLHRLQLRPHHPTPQDRGASALLMSRLFTRYV